MPGYPYKHSPFLQDKKEIRLLHLYPGLFWTPLRVQLRHEAFVIDDPPLYEALSYTWGSQSDPVAVTICSDSAPKSQDDNAELHVTQNLAEALRYLRHAHRPRVIWADAMCINQDNFSERSQQVAIMGNIYRAASRVVAFLGPQENDSDLALSCLEHIASMVEVDFDTGIMKPSAKGLSLSGEPEWADMLQKLHLGEREIVAIYHLMGRSWFGRVWIRQEVGLGKTSATVLLCGEKEVKWQAFANAMYAVKRKPLADWQLVLLRKVAPDFDQRLKRVDAVILYSRRPFKLTSLRHQLLHSECADARDRIYGILSQLRDIDTALGLVPDYTKTVTEVYVDLASRHISHFKDLTILTQCELRDSDLVLPSWVPDWSTPLNTLTPHFVTPVVLDRMPSATFISDGRLLRAYGVCCGRISHIAQFEENVMFSAGDAGTLREIQRLFPPPGLVAINDREPYNSTGETLVEEYCCTLCMDNFSERWHPPSPQQSSYRESIELLTAIVGPVNSSDEFLRELMSWPRVAMYCAQVREACTSRCLFVTEDGHIGLAPRLAEVGDDVFVLFGCIKPMILRRRTSEVSSTPGPGAQVHHRVVGECYAHGLMQGQPVLGELPRYVRDVLDRNSAMGLRRMGFMDRREGHSSILEEDPRLNRFLEKLVRGGHLRYPVLKELEEKGTINVLEEDGSLDIRVVNLI